MMKQHPIIKELFINEDGTKIVYNKRELKINVYQNEKINYGIKRVHFMSKTHPVAKLVCETYNGMRKDISYTVQRKDFNPDNDHHTNLFWGIRGGRVLTKRTSRPSHSNIKETDIPLIVARLLKKETQASIADSYNVNAMTIYRINKYYIVSPQKQLKQDVMNASSSEDIKTAIAKHLGYKSIGLAVQKMGRFEFEKEKERLLTTI